MIDGIPLSELWDGTEVPVTCSVCVWSWGDASVPGAWWCKLRLDHKTCEGPQE